jgi:endoglucanase
MKYILPIALIIVLIISVIITIFSISLKKKNAIQIVNDMGIGWNLGNTFDCYSTFEKMKTPDQQITLWGNVIPTKKMLLSIKKYGFKTIRFPVTWLHFMDNNNQVDINWMSRVKEVVKWIVKEKMYCILNLQHDGVNGNWLSEGITVKNKYIALWKQIANEFKSFNEYLIFESMNEVEYKIGKQNDFITLLTLTQDFVNTVRNTGGKNVDRLLLISGMNANLELTCSSDYKLPIDPFKKMAVSIHYYTPTDFTVERDDSPWSWYDDNGVYHETIPKTKWGKESDYKDMFNDFERMKKSFIDKGIPIILGETGVVTEQKKAPESIREYLFAVFSMTSSYEGIMTCLWDTSNKNAGDMNYYDKEHDRWFDDQIKENFIKISKGDFVKPSKYFSITNSEYIYSRDEINGSIFIRIESKKVSKIIFNAEINLPLWNSGFGILSYDINNNYIFKIINGVDGKIQYDNTYTFTVDVSNEDYSYSIKVEKWWGNDNITINYLRIIYKENYNIFDFAEYKKAISK